jgi:hypothetical protein
LIEAFGLIKRGFAGDISNKVLVKPDGDPAWMDGNLREN